jgi:two-component system phosphate regulon response regulator PhoB
MAGPKPRILLVEDEQDIRSLMALHLRREGLELVEAADGDEALRALQQGAWSVLVFDWMLPGMNGLELIRAVRQQDPKTPILMVTAKAEAADIVLGLETGADDYLVKPFEVPVLLARVRALLRRWKMQQETPQALASGGASERVVGGLRLLPDSHELFCNGAPVALTISEFKLLSALLEAQGKVLTRGQLIELIQGQGVSVVDRTVDTHVFGLRKKLEACGDLIETVRGVGYRIRPGDTSS